MPVYNAERFLPEAMESILGQRHGDFEFLILDDGSTDRSLEIIRSYADSRIRLVRNEKNLGLVATLNRGLALARGELVARMDADDVALPARLQRQAAVMGAEPRVVLLGSHVKVINEAGRRVTMWRFPTDDTLIRWTLLFENCFAHSAVMFRLGAVRAAGGYTPGIGAEDYDLWIRLRPHGEFKQVPQVLQRHRLRGDGLYRQFQSRIYEHALLLMRAQAEELLGQAPPLERITWLFQGATRGDPLPSGDALREAGELVRRYFCAVAQGGGGSPGRDVVKYDAASRLLCLAAANLATMPGPAARLAIQGFTLSPRGLWRRRVFGALKRGLLPRSPFAPRPGGSS